MLTSYDDHCDSLADGPEREPSDEEITAQRAEQCEGLITWHHGPKVDGESSVVINSDSLYTYSFDLDRNDIPRAFFERVSGPEIDEDTLADVSTEIAAYDYAPEIAKHYRKEAA